MPPIPGSFEAPQRADESVEEDLLLAFSTEPGGKPPESGKPPEPGGKPPEPGGKPPEATESLAARVESLERALHRSERQIESLKSDVATLVGTVDNIGKSARRPVAPAPRPVPTARTRSLTAPAGIVFGLALGVLGWSLWSRDSIDTADPISTTVAAPEAAAEELPVESSSPLQPVASLAAATPEPVTEPNPTIPENGSVQAAGDYLGSLSIDAAPGGEVFIDRQAVGQTPLRVQNLKAGSHLVWIQREGYRRFTRVVEVPADRVSFVWAELEPLQER